MLIVAKRPSAARNNSRLPALSTVASSVKAALSGNRHGIEELWPRRHGDPGHDRDLSGFQMNRLKQLRPFDS